MPQKAAAAALTQLLIDLTQRTRAKLRSLHRAKANAASAASPELGASQPASPEPPTLHQILTGVYAPGDSLSIILML